jgi:Putative adhesin
LRIFIQEGLMRTHRAQTISMINLSQTRVRLKSLSAAVLFVALSSASLPVVAADNTFDRTFTVTGPSIRIELNNPSGNVDIHSGKDGQVHIHAKVTPGGWSVFSNGEKSAQEIVANPPLEQRGDTILIGKNSIFLKNVSIDYTIEVPVSTELDATLASGGITVNKLRGPVKVTSASGYIHVYQVEREVQVSAASGSIDVGTIGGFLRVNSASGSIEIADVKGDIKASAASGSVRIDRPADRVEASSASGSVKITGASNDVKAHVISGPINVSGNPSSNRLWELKTVSGSVDIQVPHSASFLLSAEATSGDIRTSIPVIIEEQNKHSLRAHVGDSSGRVEVRTVSGEINVSGT